MAPLPIERRVGNFLISSALRMSKPRAIIRYYLQAILFRGPMTEKYIQKNKNVPRNAKNL
jgi:hypothetical protein